MTERELPLPKPDVIRKPVEPYGAVIQGEALVETIELGDPNKATGGAPYIRIELSRTPEGLWMWSSGFQNTQGGWCYRVGPKWGKFTRTRHDAIAAACREVIDRARNRGLPKAAMNWMVRLCGPAQLEMFQ